MSAPARTSGSGADGWSASAPLKAPDPDADPTLMVPGPIAVGMRPLTPAEAAHLDRMRAFLRGSGADVTDASSLSALLDQTRARWASARTAELPEAMLAALGVGLGDLVLALAPGARWVLRTAGPRPAPALLGADDAAAVVPLDDVRSRWEAGAVAWVVDYVAAAAQHLGATASTPPPVAASSAPLPHRGGAAPSPATPARSASSTAGWSPAAAAPTVQSGAVQSATVQSAAAQSAAAQSGTVQSGTVQSGTVQSAAAPSPVTPSSGTQSAAAQSAATQSPAAQSPITQSPATPGAPPVGAARPAAAPTSRRAARVPRPHLPGDLPEPPSVAVQMLALEVLDRALALATAAADPATLHLVAADAPMPLRAATDATATRHAARLARERAAVAWVARVDEQGRLTETGDPAVVVEAGDRGAATLVVAHRFEHGPVGELVIVGQGPALL
ncbi:DUF3806 domain-containing protein [Cellulomonas sp. HZM]|uniref:DUF3806 domain-containing protein n=1 Tax=Cellulomonas sp. HZM TaxID=1454010 RepID=UPI000493802C|nr:DUF3806 domain-containing protein [Cellulomonas sp. HZM]